MGPEPLRLTVFFERYFQYRKSTSEQIKHLVIQIEEKVDKILDTKNVPTQTQRSPTLKNEIDQIVYLLYDLTPEEISYCGRSGKCLNHGLRAHPDKIGEDYADSADFLIRVIPSSAIIRDSDNTEIMEGEK